MAAKMTAQRRRLGILLYLSTNFFNFAVFLGRRRREFCRIIDEPITCSPRTE